MSFELFDHIWDHWKHLWQPERGVALVLARHADPNGFVVTNAPAIELYAHEAGYGDHEVRAAITALVAAGHLEPHPPAAHRLLVDRNPEVPR